MKGKCGLGLIKNETKHEIQGRAKIYTKMSYSLAQNGCQITEE